ncbi:RNA polymerase sigma factor [Nannocystis punicea]|uniref:Sigma-70 family RNA polymerase sigma factor n=1 Tax=Nannocystis punicea TaxID=2995304 RepID=A0ABY7HCI5_9BACT|nr:sigma-70 family RNA polymerase sigma factor [Nannocystis poenicansa]WAS96990.1 sigma-70 family RNA polymerase sigma factor [Nannocystis poenicansa]
MSFVESLLKVAMQAQAPVAEDLTALRAAVFRRLHSSGWRPSLQPARGLPHMRRSDEALLAAFLAGDADAFEELAKRHLAWLVGHVRRNLARTADADDLVQDAWIVLLERGAEVLRHPSPNVAGFIFGVLRNRIRKTLGTRDFGLDSFSEPVDAVDLADLMSERQQWARVVRLLERECNLLEQEVLARVLDGLKNTEIADALELKPGHVRKLKHDALKKIRAALRQEPA